MVNLMTITTDQNPLKYFNTSADKPFSQDALLPCVLWLATVLTREEGNCSWLIVFIEAVNAYPGST